MSKILQTLATQKYVASKQFILFCSVLAMSLIGFQGIAMPVCTTPTAQTVTGGGSYCSGGAGVAIGLNSSQSGVNYQLYNGASAVGSPVSGTGSAISFGSAFTAAGTYTVLATVAANTCTATMTGSAVVSINALPTVTFTAQPGATACGGVNVTYTTEASMTNYAWSVPGTVGVDYTITSGGIGTTSNTVTLRWVTGGAKTVTVNYTNGSGCTAASPTSSTATTIQTKPTVTSVSPLIGNPSSAVTITGTNFNTTAANNIVYFGATAATVVTATATSLNVTVPLGATYSTVRVTNNACPLQNASLFPFLPKYDNSANVSGTLNLDAKVDFSTPSGSPVASMIFDVDNDGKSDIVIGYLGTNALSIYRNTSTTGSLTAGSFASPVNVSAAITCLGLAYGDLNGDGKRDIVQVSLGGNLRVLRNTSTPGSITFGAAGISFTLPGGAGYGAAIEDLDGDGKPEIIVAQVAGSAQVFRNTSVNGPFTTASFASPVSFTTGSLTATVVVGDVDGDGKKDIVAANRGANTISVLRNTATPGSISASSFASAVNFASGSGPTGVDLADIDGDGKLDVVTGYGNANLISIYRNTSTAGSIDASSLAASVDYTTGSIGYIGNVIGIGDLDGDGKPDIASSNKTSNSISVFRNTATSGTIDAGSLSTPVDFNVGNTAKDICVGDIDGDGIPDIAVGNYADNTFSVLRNNPLHAISGTASVCVGATTTLSNTAAGGTWVSANTGVATIGSSTGVVTGVTAGTATISYIGGANALSALNITTLNVTVNALPTVAAITGTLSVCESSGTTLASATTGGTWTSSNASVTIGSTTGIVSGIIPGTSTISYAVTNGFGCTTTVTATVSVNSLPSVASITGTGSVCVGSVTTFADATTGGVWTSGNTSVATVGSSGIVAGISAGTTTISFTVTSVFGCINIATATMTVNPLPSVAAITGTMSVCEAATTTVASTTAGGVWVSGTASVATISASGIVTGVSAGVTTISYAVTSGFGCTTTVTATVTVNAVPSVAPITGIMSVCASSTTTLASATTGGNWTSSNAFVTIGSTSGIVTGIAAGTSTISYSVTSPFGCIGYAAGTVTVNPIPATITGSSAMCEGISATLSSADAGGMWTSANTTVATVGAATGVVTGVSIGTTTISYTLPTGCMTTKSVNVNQQPGAISGTAVLCVGGSSTLGNVVAGGWWLSGSTTTASVGFGAGIVSGISAGVSQITYTLLGGCYSTKGVTINPLPPVSPISGVPNINLGTTASFANSGGTWGASNSNASVSPSGLVTGLASGSVLISYSVSNGCGVAVSTYPVSVNSMSMPITGSGQTCLGLTTQLSHPYTGGTWSSSNITKATVGSTTGLVTGVSYGNVTITYHAAGTYVTKTVVVNSVAPPLTGSSSVCQGLTSQLSHSETVGTWTSSNAAVATVSSSGLVTAVAPGSATISFTINSACQTTKPITVYPVPGAISGSSSICAGATTTLTNSTPIGLSWSSSNPAVASVGSGNGIVSGVSAGTTQITYTTTVGCIATKVMTVLAVPDMAGIFVLCATTTTTLTPSIEGSTWTSSTPSVATIGSTTGILSGLTGGTSRITYSLASGCSINKVITINAIPAAITGTMALCTGNTGTLSSTTPGGTWSSGTTSVATIGTTGILTGVGAGTTIISYTNASGCRRTATVSVNSSVSAITGTASVCPSLTTALANATAGGSWSSGNITVATISPAGLVTGIAPGTANISYVVGGGCNAVRVISVNTMPAAIGGTTNACLGATSTLTEATSGGTWSSSNAAIASIGSANGLVTAVSAGTATMTYTTANSCIKTATFTSKALPAAITGNNFACVGTTSILLCPSGNGLSWTSSNTGIATIGSTSGMITGISGGTAVVTFLATTGCQTTRVVSINTTPDAGSISGANTVIIGNNISLNNPYSAGTWTTSNSGVATVSPSGLSSATVTGVSAGAATITYTVNNGCGSAFSTKNVTVTTSRPGGNTGGGVSTANPGIYIYPNPTSSVFTLSSDIMGVLKIYTIDGKEVAMFEVGLGNTALTMPGGYAAGVYMCRFSGANGTTFILRLDYRP